MSIYIIVFPILPFERCCVPLPPFGWCCSLFLFHVRVVVLSLLSPFGRCCFRLSLCLGGGFLLWLAFSLFWWSCFSHVRVWVVLLLRPPQGGGRKAPPHRRRTRKAQSIRSKPNTHHPNNHTTALLLSYLLLLQTPRTNLPTHPHTPHATPKTRHTRDTHHTVNFMVVKAEFENMVAACVCLFRHLQCYNFGSTSAGGGCAICWPLFVHGSKKTEAEENVFSSLARHTGSSSHGRSVVEEGPCCVRKTMFFMASTCSHVTQL